MPLTRNKKKLKEEAKAEETKVEETAKPETKAQKAEEPAKVKPTPAPEKNADTRAARAELRAKSKNNVTYTGVVVRTHSPKKGVFKAVIATKTNNADKSDYPTVTFFGRMANKVQEMLEHAGKYPKVTISGHFQTNKKVRGDETRYFQDVIGSTFNFAQSALEKALNINTGSVLVKDENEVALLGELANVYIISPDAKSSRARLTIKTDNGRFAFVETTFFSLPKSLSSSLEKGQTVAFFGSMQTGKREVNGKPDYFETVVGRELALVI